MNQDARKKRIKILLVIFVGIILAAGSVFAFWSRNVSLQMDLGTDTEITLEAGQVYEAPDITLTLQGMWLAQRGFSVNGATVHRSGDVDTDTIGTYEISYEANYGVWSCRANRVVHVVDTQPPVIELVQEEMEPQPGVRYEEPGFHAYDNYDGDLTAQVICTYGDGVVFYEVADSSGNRTTVERQVAGYDFSAPVIVLNGAPNISIRLGTVYSEPGFTATDDIDGDLTSQVSVEGAVDWLKPGEYTIFYRVCDSSGNETLVLRNVQVQGSTWPDTQWPEEKTIYLTFDDGPGPYTMMLLDILDQYGIKATFFVVDSDYRDVMKEIVNRGHSIGIHSVTHDYGAVYASPEAYFADLYQMQQIIYDTTGVMTTLVRFPGGGSNLVSKNTCPGLMSILTWAVRDAGFQYFDWNVDSLDAGGATRTVQVQDNVIQGLLEVGTGMVLQHDIHQFSVKAVEAIILWGLENGYAFCAIEQSTPGFHHDVVN